MVVKKIILEVNKPKPVQKKNGGIKDMATIPATIQKKKITIKFIKNKPVQTCATLDKFLRRIIRWTDRALETIVYTRENRDWVPNPSWRNHTTLADRVAFNADIGEFYSKHPIHRVRRMTFRQFEDTVRDLTQSHRWTAYLTATFIAARRELGDADVRLRVWWLFRNTPSLGFALRDPTFDPDSWDWTSESLGLGGEDTSSECESDLTDPDAEESESDEDEYEEEEEEEVLKVTEVVDVHMGGVYTDDSATLVGSGSENSTDDDDADDESDDDELDEGYDYRLDSTVPRRWPRVLVDRFEDDDIDLDDLDEHVPE